MFTETASDSKNGHRLELLRAQLRPDGIHSSEQLSGAVKCGEMLRLRRGIYLPADTWISARPWERYELVVAAVASTHPGAVFCRETALLLHGLPLWKTPEKVTLRTHHPGWAGTRRPPSLTGSAEAGDFSSWFLQRSASHRRITPAVLRNTPTRWIEPARRRGLTRPDLRRLMHRPGFALPQENLDPDALGVLAPVESYLCEPLGLAVIDTVSRMEFAEAVVVLDAPPPGG